MYVPKKIIVIVGPTASGKSDLAVKLAKKFNGEVASADSRQVYRGMDIGTGKIPRDRSNSKRMKTNKKRIFDKYSRKFDYYSSDIRHHLLDVASPKRTFTVAQYQKLAREAIQGIWRRKKLPILCGGTGFYIQSVVDGLVLPSVKPNAALRKKREKRSREELFTELEKKDPDRALSIDSQNKRRLIRALEIADTLGKVPSLQKNPLDAEILMLGIKKSDVELRSLIEKRLKKDLKRGLVEEVRRLHDEGLSWKRLENFGLEYRFIAKFLRKEISKTDMIETLKKQIWRYAKRQLTWFKKDKRIAWITNTRDAELLSRKFL